MSAASDSPAGPQDPYAPKRLRDPEQSRPLAERRSSRPPRVEADDLSESDPQIQWLRVRPAGVQPLIEQPPLPPPELRRSFMAQFALLAGASILSALAIVVFYRLGNHAAAPAAAPQLASSSTRSVRTVAVTPPAAPGPFDEGSGNAAPPTATAVVPVPAPGAPRAAAPTSVAAAAPVIPAPAPGAAAVRGVTGSEIRFGIAAPFSGPAKELGRQMKLGLDTAFGAINDAGGINGRQLRLIAVDDGYEPSRTLGAMKDMVEKQGVFGIVGNVGTPTATVA